MSGLSRTYDQWKAHNPADEFLGPEPDREKQEDEVWSDDELPCDWDRMSGECFYCGAQIGEPCGWEGQMNNEMKFRMGMLVHEIGSAIDVLWTATVVRKWPLEQSELEDLEKAWATLGAIIEHAHQKDAA